MPIEVIALDSLSIDTPIKVFKVEAEGYEPEVLEGAIETLKLVEYVTVDFGAERGKNNNNRWGKNKIKFHLKNKGLTDDEINIGIESIDEESYLNILKKNIELYNKKLKEPNRNKLIGHLINKGYEMDLILRYIS